MGIKILACWAGLCLSATVPAFSSAPLQTSQHKNDVPNHEPGKRNPDQKQDKRRHQPGHSRETTPKQVNPGDVPHRQPGKKSPDLKQPAPGTVPKSGDRG